LAELARVMTRVNAHEAVKENSARLLREEMRYFEMKHRDEFSIDFYKMYDRYIERLREEARIAQDELDAIRPTLDKAREVVVERGRGRKALEILKDRYREKHDHELRKQERKGIEEAGMQRGRPPLFKEITSENKRKRSGDGYKYDPEYEEELREDEKVDALADYYEKLGIPDPRKSG